MYHTKKTQKKHWKFFKYQLLTPFKRYLEQKSHFKPNGFFALFTTPRRLEYKEREQREQVFKKTTSIQSKYFEL